MSASGERYRRHTQMLKAAISSCTATAGQVNRRVSIATQRCGRKGSGTGIATAPRPRQDSDIHTHAHTALESPLLGLRGVPRGGQASPTDGNVVTNPRQHPQGAHGGGPAIPAGADLFLRSSRLSWFWSGAQFGALPGPSRRTLAQNKTTSCCRHTLGRKRALFCVDRKWGWEFAKSLPELHLSRPPPCHQTPVPNVSGRVIVHVRGALCRSGPLANPHPLEGCGTCPRHGMPSLV